MRYFSRLRDLVLAGMLVLLISQPAVARIVYVDSSVTAGAQNGTSWANAYSSYQTALTAAVAGDSLWVANGTYFPGASGNNAATYQAKVNVRSFGGFQGFSGAQETLLTQRDFRANLTVLSGDLDNGGTFSANDAFHVITAQGVDTTATFDGFRITGGNANVSVGASDRGGGVFLFGGGVRFVNCDIRRNNTSQFGGAIYGNGHLVLDKCFIRNNTGFQGGGMYLAGGANVVRIYNCVFSNNTASNIGGAMLLGVPNSRLYNCTFSANSAAGGPSGHSIYSTQAAIVITNCIFWGDGNPSQSISGTAPTVRRCIVQNGYAPGTLILNADPVFKDSDFRISSCSPAVDAADSLAGITEDLDRAPRPFDGNNDLVAKWDLGAFEAQVPNIPPPANAIAGPNPSCANAQNVLYQPTTNNSPTNTYSWSLSGGGTIDGPNSNPTVLIDWGATTGTYTITMIERGAISACATVNTLPVSLQTAPTVTLSPSGSGAVCAGDSIQLTSTGTGVSRQWYRNGAPIPGATGTTYFAKTAGVYNIMLTGANGCADSAATRFTLSINPLPTVNFSLSTDPGICVGENLTITGPGPGNAYQWYRNGAPLGGATTQNLTVSTAGVYNLLFTNTNGCRDSNRTGGVTVVVHPLPVVSLNPTGADTICPGASLPITAVSPADTAWRWYRNGFLILGANAVTYSATATGVYNVVVTDNNGCRDSASTGFRLRVGDFVPPTPVCRNFTAFLNAAGTVTVAPAQADNGSSDNCAVSNLSLNQTTLTCAQVGVNNLTLTVTDPGNNTANCISQVTVLDTIRPNAVCANNTVYLNASGTLSVTLGMVDGGTSDNCSIGTSSVLPGTYTCADTGAHTVTVTVNDPSGNSDQCTATITVADSTRPNAVCRNTTVSLNGAGMASIVVNDVENGSTDNCGIASRTLDQTAFTCADVPGRFVTLSVRDVSGNTGTCQSYVRVQDNAAPVALCNDTIIYIDSTGQSLLGPVDVDGGSSDNCAIDTAFLSKYLFTCNDTGLNVVTYTIADADTNTASCLVNVTVRDTVAPTAVCSDTTFYLDAVGSATVDPLILGINSTDNCNFFDSAYVNVGPYTCAGIGTHSVILTVTDVTGASDSCTGLVTIADSTGPFVVCNNFNVILNPGGTAAITTPMVDGGTTDNCQLDTVFLSRYNFTCADVGVQNVTLTAFDIYGNDRQCIAQVTVQDTVDPVANCQNTTLYLNASGQATLAPATLDNGSTDNCGVASFGLSQSTFDCSDIGGNPTQLFVYDADSNMAQCVSNVTVLDTIRPVALCSSRTLYLDAGGSATLTPAMLDAGTTDNCPIASYQVSQSAFTCQHTGVHTINFTVLDPSNNSDLCVATVTVLDTTPPTTACVSATRYLDAAGVLTGSPATFAGATADNCAITSSTLDIANYNCADVGPNIVNLTFTDPSGNTSNCSANLIVLDTVGPSMTCLNPTLILDVAGTAVLTLPMVDGGSTDACGVTSRTLSQTNFDCSDVGIQGVIFTAVDASNNSRTCIATVIIQDTIRPVIQCTAPTLYLDASGFAVATRQMLAGASTDECSIATITPSDTLFDCGDLGVNNVTVTVADPSGNPDNCATTVTVIDTVRPAAVCDTFVFQLPAGGVGSVLPSDVGPSSNDNCGIDSMYLSHTTFNCSNIGYNGILLVVRDPSGHMDSCQGVVHVVDTSGATNINVSLGADTISCNGSPVVLDASGPGIMSYLWSTGDTTSSIQVSATGTYWVEIVSTIGCTGSDTIAIDAFNTPDPDLRTESEEEVICQNDSLLLLVNTGYTAYQWSTGDTGPTTMITTGGTYYVQVTDQNGCILTQSIYIQSVPFPAPAPLITPSGNVSVCENETQSLDAGPGYFSYRWSTGQTTQVINNVLPGTYYVEVWNGFGCHSVSPTVTVTQLSAPVPGINRSGDTLCASVTGTSYQWYLGSNLIVGAISQCYYATVNGVYNVQVYYSNGCDNTSMNYAFIVGRPEELTPLLGVSVFPNPTLGDVSVHTVSPIRSTVLVRLLDLHGRLLLTEEWGGLRDARAFELGDLSAGVYLMEVESGGQVARFRVVRE